jgi:hypothetical protein
MYGLLSPASPRPTQALGLIGHWNILKQFFNARLFKPSPFIPELKLWVFWAPLFINELVLKIERVKEAERRLEKLKAELEKAARIFKNSAGSSA